MSNHCHPKDILIMNRIFLDNICPIEDIEIGTTAYESFMMISLYPSDQIR